MAAPATGGIRFNNATVASVTSIAVNAQDAESGNPDISDYIITWDDSTNTAKGYVVLRKFGTPATFVVFTITAVTDNTTWLQIDGTVAASSGAWSAADVIVGGFTRAGDAGIDGDITGPGVSVDSEIVLFNGITGATVKRATQTGVLKATSGVLSAAVAGTDYYNPGGTDIALADGGTGASLVDPGADRILFWDDSAGAMAWLVPGGNFVVSGTDLKAEETHGIALSDETTAITTGTNKATFSLPYAFTVTSVYATLNTVSSSGTPTVDINEDGTTILSTKLTIDANEKTSATATTAAVISDASIAINAEIGFDIDTAGTGAKGLKVFIRGYRT